MQVSSKTFRDRIVELRRVPARELIPNPRNWRRHPGIEIWGSCMAFGGEAASAVRRRMVETHHGERAQIIGGLILVAPPCAALRAFCSDTGFGSLCGELLILAESTTRYTREGNGDDAG